MNIYDVEGMVAGGIDVNLKIYADEFVVVEGIALFYKGHELIASVPADVVVITRDEEEKKSNR